MVSLSVFVWSQARLRRWPHCCRVAFPNNPVQFQKLIKLQVRKESLDFLGNLFSWLIQCSSTILDVWVCLFFWPIPMEWQRGIKLRTMFFSLPCLWKCLPLPSYNVPNSGSNMSILVSNIPLYPLHLLFLLWWEGRRKITIVKEKERKKKSHRH